MGKVIWFTGLSGSGKTTIALKLKYVLEEKEKKVSIIDGDVIRNTLHSHLGFSKEDISINNKLIAAMAANLLNKFDYILIPIISPFEDDRKQAEEILGANNFIELYISTPLGMCINRDVKKLYEKALKGEIENFIGVSEETPYQPPQNPDIVIDTSKSELNKDIEIILNYLGV